MTKKKQPPASVLVRAKIPFDLFADLSELARLDGVTVPSYLRSLVEWHVTQPARLQLQHRPALVGLAAASAETRAKVARSGGKAKAGRTDSDGGSGMSQARRFGERGLPCPPRFSEPTSAAYRAWREGRERFLANEKGAKRV